MEHTVAKTNTKFQVPNNKFKIIKIWLRVSLMAVQGQLLNGYASLLFITGKIVRFALYFIFLSAILSGSASLLIYTKEQAIFFFLSFTFFDTLIQTIFRGIYQFRPLVVSGDFDLDLLKPLPSYFRPLFGWVDILDAITIIPFSIYTLWFVLNNQLIAGWSSVLLFLILLINSFLLAFAINLIIASIGILTTEIDHLIMIYRDVEAMARFPTDIYKPLIQTGLTFIIPITILITVPTKALLGIVSWNLFVVALGVTLFFLLFSVKFWQYALSKYTSASS